MKNFVLVFNRRSSLIIESVEFAEADRASALKKRFELERAYRDRPEVEVVSLGAASKEDLERTHTRYFKDLLSSEATA